jgi:SpoVK/Ycf46/Vps4 family AAA+-type ATPase
VFLSSPTPTDLAPDRPLVRHQVRPADAAERAEVLAVTLEPVLRRLRMRPTRLLDTALERLAWQFRLDARTTAALCLEAEAIMSAEGGGSRSAADLATALRGCFRRAIRSRMDPLARRVPLTGDEEVVLPPRQRAELELLTAEIALDQRVNGAWGLGRGRESAVVALFSGPSGTGKTHAAAALARVVGLDLYRVDLAAVLSKWVGETEERLGRLFDAAAQGGMILLFDEADALFGQRGDVKEAQDRYANITTSYLLQRIERAPVPTLLTTNLRDAIDPAFQRRFHVVIEFPFPAEEARAEIWRGAYPPRTPTRELDHERLAQLIVTGAGIARVARRAAFLAAGGDESIAMEHLLAAAHAEARSARRDLAPDEIAGWVPGAGERRA